MIKLLSWVGIVIMTSAENTFSSDSETNDGIMQDSLYRPNYPNGLYKTKEDFISRKPSEVKDILIDIPFYLDSPGQNAIPDNCFFLDGSSEKKIKNTFAISYDGYLYFQIGHITLPRNRNKKDKDQSVDLHLIQSYVRVKMGGPNYLYTEVLFASGWEKALAANTGSTRNKEVLKGVVWDYENQEFNIFRNCDDFNTFIISRSEDGYQDCMNKYADIPRVRKSIKAIM